MLSAAVNGSARRIRAATVCGDSTVMSDRSIVPSRICLPGSLRSTDLRAAAVGQLGQERIAGRALVDDRRVAEADVDARRARHALQRAVERREAVLPRLFRPRLHVGLVDLHHVGASGKQVLDLLVHRLGVVHRRVLVALVEVVLRLLRHREGAGHGDLGLARRVRLEELHVPNADGPGAHAL